MLMNKCAMRHQAVSLKAQPLMGRPVLPGERPLGLYALCGPKRTELASCTGPAVANNVWCFLYLHVALLARKPMIVKAQAQVRDVWLGSPKPHACLAPS